MVSKEMQNVINLLRKQIESTELSVKAIRDGLDLLSTLSKLPKDVKCEPVDAGGVPAEWITTPNSINKNVILYFHGGGFVAGSIKTHRDLVARISRVSKARILIIDYKLAPEHPFPAGLDDCVTAYKWLINDEKILPENIIVGGDSAGGGLTVSLFAKLKEQRVTLPAAGVCLSPGVDVTMSGESYKTKVEVDPFLSPESCEFMLKQYLGNADPRSPFLSILTTDLEGFPPLLIQVGSSEILLSDSILLAERAKSAGVDVKLEIWDDMIHVFQAFATFAPESREAIEKIGEFTQNFFA